MRIKKEKDEFIDAFEATKETREKMTFGGAIRSLRLCDEVPQVDLAKKIGVSKQFLSDVEHNRRDVGIKFAKKVADALGYGVEPLIELLIRDQLKRQKINCEVTISASHIRA